MRNQWSVIQGRRVGEWHRKHRSASAGRDRGRDHGPTGGARLLRRSPVTRGMDGEARGGQLVWVNRRHPSGISDAGYRRLTEKERRSGGWTRFVRDPELFAKGAIRHPDHATVVLNGWHRVVMNTEQGARAMRHVAFLD